MTTAPTPRLLLLACSARKRLDAMPLPALERYDGPAFRVVRRYLAHSGDAALCVRILSARFGLVAAETPLPPYDERLTPARGEALRSAVHGALAIILASQKWQSCFIYGGHAYYALMASCFTTDAAAIPHERAEGPPGVRLANLRAWLDGRKAESAAVQSRAVPRLRGVPVDLTPAQAADRLLEVSGGSAVAASAAVWMVQIDDRALPVKRAAALLTGLPTGAFGASEAVRLLRQLGLEVTRR